MSYRSYSFFNGQIWIQAFKYRIRTIKIWIQTFKTWIQIGKKNGSISETLVLKFYYITLDAGTPFHLCDCNKMFDSEKTLRLHQR